jgi:uncharacterized protein (TIGR02300 family)
MRRLPRYSHLTRRRGATNRTTGFRPGESVAGVETKLQHSPQGNRHVAKPELGSKRQCQSCSAKFFDLNRDPILCPKCGATFVAAALATRAAPRAAPVDDEPDVEPAGPELVSLDDAAAEEEKDVAVVTDDIEIEDDAPDDTFLEEEEEDSDDVADLIDSDIEDDEES